jgi:hypothetical protein
MMGMRALRKTCRHITVRSLAPLARAVRTYCLWISSSTEFLVMMLITAKLPRIMAVMGRTMCQR